MICQTVEPEQTKPIQLSQVISTSEIFDIGELVGDRYQIRAIVGQGGMGCVYDAYEHLLERHVAIKALWAGINAERLYAEAVALASLRHPSLLTVHNIGCHRGLPYLVLERLYGLTLQQYISECMQDGECSIFEALHILTSLADALDYAHKLGVAHRDLKPANVILDQSGRIVLLDFGLHSLTDHRPRVARGTPHYMAPETVRMEEQRCMPAVDIYALGIIAFELLTGKPPFDGRDAIQIAQKQLRDEPPDIGALRSDIPAHLRQLITSMLAKNPGERPTTAADVAMWLRTMQSGYPLDNPRHGEFSVLLYDDDPAMVEFLATCINYAAPFAHIETAATGREVLSRFRDAPPHVLVMDVDARQPGAPVSNIDLCAYLRATRLSASTAVVAVADDPVQSHALSRLGVHSFLTKPPHSELFSMELMAQVHKLSAMYLAH